MRIELKTLQDAIPLRNDLIVKGKTKLKTKSGIIATVNPSIIDDRPTEGEVVKIGKEVKDFKMGDYVYFDKVSGVDFTFEDEPNEWFIKLEDHQILVIKT